VAIADEERREIARWAAEAAEHALPLFEAVAPGDRRPREAIEVARAFADGERRSRHLFQVALAAHRAGGEAGDPVALAAARSASLAAATANIHGEETIGTLGHILGPAAYAALARELAGADVAGAEAHAEAGTGAAAEVEIRWAIDHATPAIRAVVGRVPVAQPGRKRLDAIQRRIEVALRAEPGLDLPPEP
jgi:hypothetical protein